MQIKVAIIGTRDYMDKSRVFFELDELKKVYRDDLVIVSGGAYSGADHWAKKYAQEKLNFKTQYIEYPAKWQDFSEPCIIKTGKNGKYNALAANKRNKQIAMVCDHAIAFWDGKSDGTNDCIKEITKLGKKVRIIAIKL